MRWAFVTADGARSARRRPSTPPPIPTTRARGSSPAHALGDEGAPCGGRATDLQHAERQEQAGIPEDGIAGGRTARGRGEADARPLPVGGGTAVVPPVGCRYRPKPAFPHSRRWGHEIRWRPCSMASHPRADWRRVGAAEFLGGATAMPPLGLPGDGAAILTGGRPGDLPTRRRGNTLEGALCELLVPVGPDAAAAEAELSDHAGPGGGADYVLRLDRRPVARGPFVRLPRVGPMLVCRTFDGAPHPSCDPGR